MIESIELLLLAIPFLLAAVFVVQTMTETSRTSAWAAPAAVRSNTRRSSAAASTADMGNVSEMFAGSMAHDGPDHAAAA